MRLFNKTINGRKVTATAPVIDILLRANEEEEVVIGAVINSTWRSYAMQYELYTRFPRVTWTLDSNHRRGMAVDLYPDHDYYRKMEPILNSMGLYNPLRDNDRGHFIYGKTENEVRSKFPIIDDDSNIEEYNPAIINVAFVVTADADKDQALRSIHGACNMFAQFSDGEVSIKPKIIFEKNVLNGIHIGVLDGKETTIPDASQFEELYEKHHKGVDIVHVISKHHREWNLYYIGKHFDVKNPEVKNIRTGTHFVWQGLTWYENDDVNINTTVHEILHTVDDFYRLVMKDYSFIDLTHEYAYQKGGVHLYIEYLKNKFSHVFDSKGLKNFMDAVAPKIIARDLSKEQRVAQELQNEIYARFAPHDKARDWFGKNWFLAVNAIAYRGYSPNDLINHAYSVSRAKGEIFDLSKDR